MKQPDEPLAWWGRSQTRRPVAISFLVALLVVFFLIFSNISKAYDEHSVLRNLSAFVAVVLGLWLAFLELRHSGEANEHRAEQNRLSDENNKLQRDTHALQSQIHQLQESIEKKLTKVRLYVRAHFAADGGLQLLVSNLSEFDLWINQVELIVTEGDKVKPANRPIIGGGNRISRGYTENGYLLFGTLVSINGDRTDPINMKFHVKVVATGVTDDAVTISSPKYHLKIAPGKTRELNTLEC